MSVDIVNLIESNPIAKFNGDYHCKLVEKVKNNFTNYEQQMFLSSFYCYLKYDTKNDFVIDLDNIWKWLGFSSKFNAKRLLENNFIINNDYNLLLQTEKQDDKMHGGHNKERFMLNIITFKKFCLKAGTRKADEVHDYFVKLENIMFEILKEESVELKQQLMQIENVKNKEIEEKILLEREKILLDKFASAGSLIYIIKVKTYENGTYVIKIGHSQKGVQSRYNEHKTRYDECILLDCFSLDKSKDFESFIHHHKQIACNKVTNLEGHEKDNELFLIGKDLTYQMVLKIIDDNINNYNYKVRELLLEIENLKLKNEGQTVNNDNELLKELIQTNKMLVNKVSSLESSMKEILNKLNSQETKIVTGFNQQLPTLGPRLQKINPENLQLIKVYESVTEAMNENKNIKRPSIMKAIDENTIYCGFRWQLVERNLDPNIIHELKPTKETKVQNTGYIAKLNKEQTKILNVYLDRKTASQLNGYISSSALDIPVKNFSLSKDHYYVLYEKVDETLKNNFENENGIPLLYKDGVGQYNHEGILVKEFSCKYDCIKELKMSDKTLAKALDKNIMYNNHCFKSIGSKLSTHE
jgi:hypothetical protein